MSKKPVTTRAEAEVNHQNRHQRQRQDNHSFVAEPKGDSRRLPKRQDVQPGSQCQHGGDGRRRRDRPGRQQQAGVDCLTSAPMGQFRHIAERRVSGSS